MVSKCEWLIERYAIESLYGLLIFTYGPSRPHCRRVYLFRASAVLISVSRRVFIDGIRFYGLAYLVGFLVAWLLFKTLHKRGLAPLDANARADFSLYLIFG